MSKIGQLKVELQDSKSKNDIISFLESVKEDRGTNPSLAAAVILQIGVKEFIRINKAKDNLENINGFVYFNDTLAFYQKNKKAILDWVLAEAESLSNVYSSAIDMVVQLPALQNDDVTADEMAQLMWRTNSQNMKDDEGLYALYANAVSGLLAVRVINYYSDWLYEKNENDQ